MSRRLLLILSIHFLLFGEVHSQLQMRHIDRTSPETARVGHANARTNSDPLSLPFFDDFSTAVDVPDTNLWEYGEHVFINNSIGENPPSLNVATFDGAQRNGTPYQLSEEKPGPTDSLISRVIDLSNIPSSEQPDIFISFYWQLRGLGEIPESVDSIQLQLLAADSVWYAVWSAQGGFNNLDTAFKRFNYEEINVQRLEGPDRVFFHDNFRLRFQAYSTFRGIFDTWNIDYVYINRLSRMPVLNSPGIFRILDRSLSGNTTPLFAPYYEVPSSQVPATFEEQVFGMSNLDIGDLHPVVFTHTLRNMNSNAVIARLEVTEGIPSLRAGEIRRIAGIPGGPFPAIEDSTVIMSEFIYVSGDTLLQERTRLTQDTVFYPSPTLELNDTLRQTYLLHQHYAYDDGTAEFSAGINLDQGQVAVQFVSRELDTLTHIDVHFPALPTTDGRPMDIVVWKDLTEDGEITRASHIVQGSSQRNEFTRIRLSRGQILQDTFYIGFQQFTDDYVGVGLDRSNEAATGKVFVNVTRDWVQNTEIVGALMMRPVFGDADDLILSSPSSAPTTPTLYPNPAETFLRIEGRYDRLEVFDLGGRQRLRSSYTTELDVSQLPRGLYIVRFYSGRDATTTKLIIE